MNFREVRFLTIAFVWDNFGPMHVDRCEAVAEHYGLKRKVYGIELYCSSNEYDWISEGGVRFEKLTLYSDGLQESVVAWRLAAKIVRTCRGIQAKIVFLCNYERVGIALAAFLLRASGIAVFTMGCSKFDDQQRFIWRELAKRAFFLPYHGALSSGVRARDYMRCMGFKEEMIQTEYNTLSISRIQNQASVASAPAGTPFSSRHFSVIARFIPKKNITMALEAYALYARSEQSPVPLHICGTGPLENSLRERSADLAIADKVVFRGFLQREDIARELGSTLAMILPSVEEQFGNVVIEAQALGVPVIASIQCGARDRLLRNGVNGFLIEPDNPVGLSRFMKMLATDAVLWREMAEAANKSAALGDVARFVSGVQQLLANIGIDH